MAPVAKPHGRASEIALQIYREVLEAVSPSRLIGRCCSLDGPTLRVSPITGEDYAATFHLGRYRNVFLCGAGKASCGLAKALLDLLGERVTGGLIVTKYGHGLDLGPVRVMESGHPIPDRASRSAGEAMLAFAKECSPEDLVLFLLSGGASALMEAPEPEVDLLTISEVTQMMMAAGANIYDLNAVRSRLSRIKGGKLGACFPEWTTLCLVLSDVIGNDFTVIGSGPLWRDGTERDVTDIAERFGVLPLLPEAAIRLLRDTPERKGGTIRHVLIGSPNLLIPAVLQATEGLGIQAVRVPAITHEARDEGAEFALNARQLLSDARTERCVFATGEPVVTVRGKGKGGRCQEFACAAADMLVGREDLAVLAGSTDGTDGPTDAAGGLVDSGSAARADAKGWKAEAALRDNNSRAFLEACDGLIHTGPTQSNVNDLFLAVRA